jgi:metallophosphoesterase (TIGR03767 family)
VLGEATVIGIHINASSRRLAVATIAALTLALTALVAGRAGAHDTTGKSTVDQTIVPSGGTGFNFLQLGPGEPYLLREDLAAAKSGRVNRRVSLAYFGQITDFQLADEESPAREERFDSEPFNRAAASGYRPHEALVVDGVEASLRQMNQFLTSPVAQGNGTHAQMLNAVMTGDLADSMQFNETNWVRTLLEGGNLNPGSGTKKFNGTACQGLPTNLISDVNNPNKYTGVGDYDDYANDNPMYYDPESLAGTYASDGWPTYPNLFDRAQVPFQAQGLGAPTYVVFGNHDALYQGTVSAGPGLVTPGVTFEDVAVNCLKPVYPLVNEQSTGPPPNLTDLLAGASTGQTMLVPPDSDRRYVDKHQFKDLFRSGGSPPNPSDDDHGFAYIDPAEKLASNDQASYYSFEPKEGLRYIVLDTNSESGVLTAPSFSGGIAGGQSGNIDNPQFQWLQGELNEADQAGELVVTFAHHNIKTLTNAAPDEVSPCSGVQQFGHDRFNPSCDRDPRSSTPLHSGEELANLLHQHPNVIALVAGHTHENQIEPFSDGNGGGFWEITTPAIADWPPQHRVIDVMDNKDGTLSIFTTTLDHDSPSAAPSSGTDAAGFSVAELASVARALTYNDPQEGPGKEGAPADRNAELLIRDPINDPPTAVNDSYNTQGSRTLSVAPPGVLANDSDPEGDAMTAALASGPSRGTLTFNPNGSFTYKPALGFKGTDSFTYRASDGQSSSNVATVTIKVTPPKN